MQYLSKSSAQTKKIARDLAKKIIRKRLKNTAQIIALKGELGAGKTTFIQGFIKHLCAVQKVRSPTFLLIKKYPIQKERDIFHIDCYRIKNYKELIVLGIRAVLQNPANIVLIEWAERVQPILPKKKITVHIDHVSKNERKINIK